MPGDLPFSIFFSLFYLSRSQEHLGKKYCKTLTALKSSSPLMLWQERRLCMRRYLCLIKTIQPRCRFVAPWSFSAQVSEVTSSLVWFFAVRSTAHAGRACCSPRLQVRHEENQLCNNCLSAAVLSRDPQGCAGAREVSGPAVTNIMQRKKQNKGINNESEVGWEKSLSESSSDGAEDRLVGVDLASRGRHCGEDRAQDQWGGQKETKKSKAGWMKKENGRSRWGRSAVGESDWGGEVGGGKRRTTNRLVGVGFVDEQKLATQSTLSSHCPPGHPWQKVPALLTSKGCLAFHTSSGQWKRPATIAVHTAAGLNGLALKEERVQNMMKLWRNCSFSAVFSAQPGSCTGSVSEHFVSTITKSAWGY